MDAPNGDPWHASSALAGAKGDRAATVAELPTADASAPDTAGTASHANADMIGGPLLTPPEPAHGDGAASSPSNPRQPVPATKREIRAWYNIDWASSVYGAVGIGGFLPLLTQSAALAASGFPTVCPNVITDKAAIAEVFGNVTTVASMFYRAEFEGLPCKDPTNPRCIGGYCQGVPGSTADCLLADGLTQFPLRVVGTDIDPTSYATSSISASVGLQAVAFLLLASVADYGTLRKKVLMLTSYVGAVFAALCAGITPATWWAGAPLMVISNVAFGISNMVYNAYLPVLVKAHPDVLAAAAEEKKGAEAANPIAIDTTDASQQDNDNKAATDHASVASHTNNLDEIEKRVSHELSSKGFLAGFASSIIGILMCIPWPFFLPEITAYQIVMLIAGLWWGIFIVYTGRYLLPRPGPPLPPGTTYLGQSVRTIKAVGREVKELPVSMWYLVLWAIYSDGVFTIGTVGGLVANSDVEWGCIPKGLGILSMFLLVPIFAAFGNMVFLRAGRRYSLSGKTLLIAALAGSTCLPIYGITGIFSRSIGIRQGWEIEIVAAWYAFFMGPMQSYARSIFSYLIPTGRESTFFSIYELTNRGTSWLGPQMITAAVQATGEVRYALIFLLISIMVGIAGLCVLDVDKGKKMADAVNKRTAAAAGGDGVELTRSEDDNQPLALSGVGVSGVNYGTLSPSPPTAAAEDATSATVPSRRSGAKRHEDVSGVPDMSRSIAEGSLTAPMNSFIDTAEDFESSPLPHEHAQSNGATWTNGATGARSHSHGGGAGATEPESWP